MAKETRVVHVKVTSNVGKVGKETKKASTQAKGLSGSLKGVGASAKIATGGIRAMASALLTSGVGAIVIALGGFVSVMRSALMESMEFEKALKSLQAVAGLTDEGMTALSDDAKRLGASTAFTAAQVVELQTEFAKLGFSRDEILNVTEATLNLAAASGTELAEAATVAGATIRGFGLASEETARVTDVMAKSFSSSALDLGKFQESMKLVAPIAKTTRVSLEQASAALSVLADRGISGSMAGTQLKRIMSDLAQKTGKDFQTSLKITADRLATAKTTADKLAIAKKLVGDRAKGSLIALAENRDVLNDLAKAYEHTEEGSKGAAKAMADLKLDNLSGDVTILKSAWSGFLLGIEDGKGALNSIARGAVQNLTRAINNLQVGTEFLGFTFERIFGDSENSAASFAAATTVRLANFLAHINKFSLNAKAAIASIPIIGQAIDKDELYERIKLNEKVLIDSANRLAVHAENQRKKDANRVGFWEEWKSRKKEIEQRKTESKSLLNQEAFIEGTTKSLKKGLTAEELARDKFRIALKKKEEDFAAQDDLSKIELAKQRHLAELETLEFNTEQKELLKKQIEDYYLGLKEAKVDELMTKDDERQASDRERKHREEQEELDRLERERQAKVQMQMDVFENAANIAGRETALGKAMFVAKQILMAKELILEAKNSIKKAAIRAAESGAEVTGGFAKAAATLNPAIIAGYAVSAAGIIASISSAFKASKDAASAAGVSGGGSMSTTPIAPSFNVVGASTAGEQMIGNRLSELAGTPMRAYVVEGDVSNAQELGRRVEDTASIGG